MMIMMSLRMMSDLESSDEEKEGEEQSMEEEDKIKLGSENYKWPKRLPSRSEFTHIKMMVF